MNIIDFLINLTAIWKLLQNFDILRMRFKTIPFMFFKNENLILNNIFHAFMKAKLHWNIGRQTDCWKFVALWCKLGIILRYVSTNQIRRLVRFHNDISIELLEKVWFIDIIIMSLVDFCWQFINSQRFSRNKHVKTKYLSNSKLNHIFAHVTKPT